MIIINYLEKKRMAMMRVAAANQDFLKYASGYPPILSKTLAKSPENISVYGANGGVRKGDKSINLFNPSGFKITTANINSDGYINRGSGSTFEIEIEANTQYTFVASKKIASLGGYYFSYGFSENRHTAAGDGIALYPFERLSSSVFSNKRTVVVTSPANANYLYVVIGNDRTGDTYDKKFMLVEGSYTDSDAPDYKPYGYTIPIIVSGNLYDANTYQLTTGKYIKISDGTTVNSNNWAYTNDFIPCDAWQGKKVTINKRPSGTYPGIAFYSNNNVESFIDGITFNSDPGTEGSFNVPNNANYIRFTVPYNATDIVLNYGSTALSYEPYITPKSYNVYSDAPILLGDDVRVYPNEQKAYRGTTDISALQDWTQDWKLPKANNLTVVTNTTILPSCIDVGYYSSSKDWELPYWGVSFEGSAVNGTRLGQTISTEPTISTNTVEGQSEFDKVPAFQAIRVNGYFNGDGSFTETATEGVDNSFAVDGTNGDVYVRFRKQYHLKSLNSSADGDDMRKVTHLYKDDSGIPMHRLFHNLNTGEDTQYAYIAAYKMGLGSNDKVASISGIPTMNNFSYDAMLTATRAKDNTNKQYSGMVTPELDLLTTLFMIEYKSRNSQSVLYDCTSYNIQVKATEEHTDVEYITVSPDDATEFVVGSIISLGTSTNRNNSTTHSIINCKKITAIDTSTGIITIDNGGTTFNTDTNTYISTMPWQTGITDNIRGHTGNPVKNGKYPNKYRGVEDLFGHTWTIMADVLVKNPEANAATVVYKCDSPLNYNISITSQYKALYGLANSNRSIKSLGYDEQYPYINIAVKIGGSDSTYYCDYFNDAQWSPVRFVNHGCDLSGGTMSGLNHISTTFAPTAVSWSFATRLSGNGWRG